MAAGLGVLAILTADSVFCCISAFLPFLGIIACVMANADLRLMNAGQMDEAGRTSTVIGLVLGVLSTIIILIGVIVVVMAV